MSITGFLRRHYGNSVKAWWELRARHGHCPEITRADWELSCQAPTTFYHWCFRYFHTCLPPDFREHRRYFHDEPGERRGFGEDAFHTMWFLLLRELKPASFLEIGVFRGQVLSLAALWARLAGTACAVHGISPFSALGDSVTAYRPGLDYRKDTLNNFAHFGLPAPRLVQACSSEPAALDCLRSRPWDMIYIDGNHDYEVVRQDWLECARHIKPGGIIVLDDAGLTSQFEPPAFATKGHPGPSRAAAEVDRKTFHEILQVGHNRAFQRMA